MLLRRAPEFWYKEPTLLQKIILKPIAGIYSYLSTKNYGRSYRHESPWAKVVAVGGITAGGSGKTMVVQSICEILQSKNRKVAVLSRGYGRSGSRALRVNNKMHTYQEVGDEPLLLSAKVPVYVGRDRFESASLARTEGFEFLILDDGITQKYLKPNIKLVVIDEEQRFGNGEMLPLGPTRLDFEKIKADLDGIIILGKGKNPIDIHDIPSCRGKILQDFSKIGKRIIIFCGIGYPDKFFNSFSSFEIIEKVVFPDHYPFSNEDIEELVSRAGSSNAQLVTTEKDFLRIPEKYRYNITAVPVKIVLDTSEDATLCLERILQ
jgi:tetraacyldisaccharide 4'-kinase